MTNPIIVALDVGDEINALDIVEELRGVIDFYKVGLQLYLAEGGKIVKVLQALDKKVFLDLKFFDIPNTVYEAVKQALRLKPDMLTFHCLGGEEMLKAAVKAKNEAGAHTNLLGVTMLTSMEKEELSVKDESSFVLKMAQRAKDAGLDGVVCSPEDASKIRKIFGGNFLIICPGIRKGVSKDDQKRTGSPKETIEAGADYLVVGRPILLSSNKRLTAEEILKSTKRSTNG